MKRVIAGTGKTVNRSTVGVVTVVGTYHLNRLLVTKKEGSHRYYQDHPVGVTWEHAKTTWANDQADLYFSSRRHDSYHLYCGVEQGYPKSAVWWPQVVRNYKTQSSKK
ncbi:MAG: hypothetical protein OXT72_15580 [Gammaproteobacteria bacterium]|nr:hypothetical protein [Gammaproteobacteria bacterium]MDE0248222.1 hypothetical protein [Gammaproteobacteria bacterium]